MRIAKKTWDLPSLSRASVAFIFPVLLLTSACATTKAVPEAEAPPLPPVVQFMVANVGGASSELEDPDFGGMVRVTLEDTFMSATGTMCKRATILSSQQDAEVVIVCRNGEQWEMMPRIWGRGINQ